MSTVTTKEVRADQLKVGMTLADGRLIKAISDEPAYAWRENRQSVREEGLWITIGACRWFYEYSEMVSVLVDVITPRYFRIARQYLRDETARIFERIARIRALRASDRPLDREEAIAMTIMLSHDHKHIRKVRADLFGSVVQN